MLIDDDMRVMQWAMSANATRLQVTAQNVANINTPGYKRKIVDFQSSLDEQMDGDGLGIGDPVQTPMPPPGPDSDLGVQFSRANWDFDRNFRGDDKPAAMWMKDDKAAVPFSVNVITDPGAMRVDGNGVVVEKEIAEMGKASGQYSLMASRLGGAFKILTSIIQAR